MLPWLFPIYLTGASCGFIATALNRKARWSAVVWTFLVISTISVMVITFQSPPHLEGGPGGLTAFGLIPNIIVFGICSIILIALLIFHPPSEALGQPWTLLAVIPWALIACVLATVPWMWGYYPLTIHVVDWQGKPLGGVKIHFLEERLGISLEQAFLADDVTMNLITDSAGNVTYEANNYRKIFGAVNGYWQDPGNKALGNASFNLQPYGIEFYSNRGSQKQELQISWTAKGQSPGTNDKFYTTSVSRPYSGTLTIFLPDVGGEDESPYPSSQEPH